MTRTVRLGVELIAYGKSPGEAIDGPAVLARSKSLFQPAPA
jgi:hypothetical protein